MATGQSTRPSGSTDELLELISAAEFVTVLARPMSTHLLAAATIAATSPSPFHLRIIDGDDEMPTPVGDVVIGTEPTLPGIDRALEPSDPLTEAVAVARRLGGSAIPPAAALVATTDRTPQPGVTAVLDDVAAVVGTTTRIYGPLSGREADDIGVRLREADFPEAVSGLAADEAAGRRFSSWLATTVLEADGRPASAASALEDALGPTYTDTGPTPTVEGLDELLEVLAGAEPDLAVAAILADRWESAIERYCTESSRIHDAVGGLPVDRPGPLVVAEAPAIPLEPAVRLWSGYRLADPYGLLVRGDDPVRLALGSTGPRSASALLEAVVGRHGGARWGDERVAGGMVAADRRTVEETITGEL